MHREREVPNSGYRFDSGNTLRQDAVTSAVFLAVKTSRYRCLAPPVSLGRLTDAQNDVCDLVFETI